MEMDPELASFLSSPVMIIIGTSDEQCRPEIGRAVGAAMDCSAGVAKLVVSAWQWPQTIRNLRANGRAAVTFARPSDYVSFQVKGRADIMPAGTEDILRSERYMADILTVLSGLGLDPRLAAPWLTNRDAVSVRIELDAVFVQTPGPKAGQQVLGQPR
jgi:hypothetical protein